MYTHLVKRILAMLCCLFLVLIYSTFAMSVISANVTSNEMKVEAETKVEKSKCEKISWINKMKSLKSGIRDCSKQLKKTTWNCFKITSLHMFNEMLLADVIPIWHGVRFVRSKSLPGALESIPAADKRKDVQYLTWFDLLAIRLAETFQTHMLEINLKELTDAYFEAIEKRDKQNNLKNGVPNGTARHRRQRYNMMITMMFGVTALGAVLVPMGFQMLSVVSGKALLLAKMALLLASINGLKRVANSGVHYGLYHVPGDHYGTGYYDRGDVHHPRNVPTLTVAQPLELGI